MNLEKNKETKIDGSMSKQPIADDKSNFFTNVKQNLNLKKTVTLSVIAASFVCSIIGINNINKSNSASASITKTTIANAHTGLNTITYNGEAMYVANATFYDYYSDSQIGTSATPGEISDALASGKNTFSKFNKKLYTLMKYNDPNLCPAKYPLYQGRPGALIDMEGIAYPHKEETYKASNYWAGANWGQVSGVATQGLVDNTLMKDSSGYYHITQSNSTNNKSAKLPFFDKEFLTKNKYDDSKLTLGSVKENVAFPFRRVIKDDITYYEFYSSKDTIRFNNSGSLDYLGYNKTSEQVKDAVGNYGFFPYNNASEGKSNKLNFGHGVRIDIPFNMTKDGKINGKDMIFEFSGDDDVWVYIDGHLALDIGGNHGEVAGSINFAKKESIVDKVKNPALAFASRTISSFKAGENTLSDLGITNVIGVYNDHKTAFSTALKNSLKDTSKTHTLTLFYMERGLNVANMKMQFNLPEPSVLTVTNTVKTEGVGDSFLEETKKVAAKDNFMYDVLDKTISRKDEIELLNDEAVTFSNEFEKNDHILVQQKGLKISSRNLTTLYSTNWTLNDIATEISKGTNLLVTDSRSTTDKSFLFANKSNDKVPVLTANYINKINTGDFELNCNVTDEYKEKNKDYKKHTFTYTIKHSNIFGGNSKANFYKGKYTLYKEDGETDICSTVNGNVTLKPNEKIIIKDIPVTTKLEVNVTTTDSTSLKEVKTTDNFTSKIDKKLSSGAIVNTSNVMKFTLSTATDKAKEKVTHIDSDKNKKNDPLKELEDINETDGLDASPKTSDNARVNLWITFFIISLITCIGAFIYLYKLEKNNI